VNSVWTTRSDSDYFAWGAGPTRLYQATNAVADAEMKRI
jgi:hypothetical protein